MLFSKIKLRKFSKFNNNLSYGIHELQDSNILRSNVV